MTEEAKILEEVRQNVEMGIDGINTICRKVKDEAFLSLLETQRTEYRSVLAEAGSRLNAIGAPVESRTGAGKVYAKMFSGAKALTYSRDSEIAEDMIKGTTAGISKMMRSLSDTCAISQDTRAFAEKLVKTEEKNVEDLKKFL